jgi:hypothetical protein
MKSQTEPSPSLAMRSGNSRSRCLTSLNSCREIVKAYGERPIRRLIKQRASDDDECRAADSAGAMSMPDSEAHALQGRSIALTTRHRPDFAAMTAGKMMFGAIGAVAMIHAGNTIVDENGVEDPSVYIGQQLLQSEVSQNGGVSAPAQTVVADTHDAAKLTHLYTGADFILDVQTVNWSFIYFPTNYTHYKVIYSAKLRIIDAHKGNLVAEGFCVRKGDDEKSHPRMTSYWQKKPKDSR